MIWHWCIWMYLISEGRVQEKNNLGILLTGNKPDSNLGRSCWSWLVSHCVEEWSMMKTYEEYSKRYSMIQYGSITVNTLGLDVGFWWLLHSSQRCVLQVWCHLPQAGTFSAPCALETTDCIRLQRPSDLWSFLSSLVQHVPFSNALTLQNCET